MKDRVLCRYGREQGTDDQWDLWFAMSACTWESAVEDFPTPAGFEFWDVWITVDNDEIQKILNTLDVDAEIENVQTPEKQ